tara:strand:+ start:3119 stop:4255 length:1137 start_codon:yes stop_codon:yes gene_type:complete
MTNSFWNLTKDSAWKPKKKDSDGNFAGDELHLPWDLTSSMIEMDWFDELRKSNFGAPLVVLLMGRRGHGKTLFMTAMARHMIQQYEKAKSGYRLFSNYRIDYMRKTPSGDMFDVYSPYLIEDVMGYPDWFRNGYLLLDEIQTAASGRRSMSRSNVFLSTFMTQIRHRNIEAIATTQFPQVIDYQLLLQCDLFCSIEIAHRNEKGIPDVLTLYIHDYWGQWTGKDWRKYWPPRNHEADAVKKITGVASVIGHYSTEQIIAPTFMDDYSRSAVIMSEEAKFELDGKEKSTWAKELEDAQIEAESKGYEAPQRLEKSLDDFIDSLSGSEIRINSILTNAKRLSPIQTVSELGLYMELRGWTTRRGENGALLAERIEDDSTS